MHLSSRCQAARTTSYKYIPASRVHASLILSAPSSTPTTTTSYYVVHQLVPYLHDTLVPARARRLRYDCCHSIQCVVWDCKEHTAAIVAGHPPYSHVRRPQPSAGLALATLHARRSLDIAAGAATPRRSPPRRYGNGLGRVLGG